MKLKITFKEIPKWKQEYIMQDFKHFFAEMKFQTLHLLEKIEKNKGVQARLVNRLKRTKTFSGQVLSMELAFEGIANSDLGSATFEKHNGNMIAYFEMNEFYFEMVEALKSCGQGIMGYGLVDKKRMIKDFNKAIRKNITHKFVIEQLE